MENKLVDTSEIKNFIEQNNYSDAAKLLLSEQQKSWPQCNTGYASLDSVQVKEFYFEAFKIKVQFNPGRIISSSAKVDPKSIRERKCFLCPQNLPEEQKGIFLEDYLILCNPFPIFPEHFTIPRKDHIPQRIVNSFDKLLLFSKELGKYYCVFYNGPKCGASAPDHLHFQAGTKSFMPIDNEFHSLKNEYGEILFEQENILVSAVDDSLRRFFVIESTNAGLIQGKFNEIYESLLQLNKTEDEPMLNIISFYEEEYGWRVLIFPREKHRPSHFFKEGDGQILLSPASVDIGGVCITPVEKDFNKITKENLREIFGEVIINKTSFDTIKAAIKK